MMGRTDGQTDRQTDARQFHRPCFAYYASSVNNSDIYGHCINITVGVYKQNLHGVSTGVRSHIAKLLQLL